MTAPSGDGGTTAAEILGTPIPASTEAPAAAAKSRPRSATVSWINFSGFAGFLAASMIVPRLGLPVATQILLMLATPAIIIVALEALFVRDRIPFLPMNRRGYISTPTGVPALRRKYLKLVGLAVSIAGVAAVFWMFPLYRDGGASQLLAVVNLLWLPFLLLAPIYVWFVDNRMEEPEDGYFHLGLLVSGAWNLADRDILKQHALQWGVKAFFLPLMIGFLANDLSWIGGNPIEKVLLPFAADPSAVNWIAIYEYLFRYAFLLDVTIASVGYVMTLKLFDAHLRSAEPTLLGWAVCLVCYPPFWSAISTQFLHYDAGTPWGFWFEGWPMVKVAWSVLIIACLSIYVWATIQFGVRFSNLTHRGILTNGPYRWLKHPAYLSKNISWWLVSVPFISGAGASEAVRLSLLLLAVNGIYYMRAKTEERHLSNDPIYREYLAFMRENDAFAVVRRWVRGVAGHPQQALRSK
jgi:protein-S-isoprenylcysteine O-methyltransferase Ste14